MVRAISMATSTLAVVALVACSSSEPHVATEDEPAMNHLQYIGSHNSYHLQHNSELHNAEKAAVEVLGDDAGDFGDIDSLQYSHRPLTRQLEDGIRSFELDVWADPNGGLFANPLAPRMLGVEGDPVGAGMNEPGFKVLHIADIDYYSTCNVFVVCLEEIKDFSQAHPTHPPIVILVELKDEALPSPLDVTEIVAFDSEQMDALDEEIRSVFGDAVLTPDEVRGDHRTLRDAAAAGWPSLSESRGQTMFILDNAGDYRTNYIDGHPSLSGRMMFTSSGIGQDDGAVAKINDPGTGEEIRSLVDEGYFVRTRADAGLEVNELRRTIALQSGAQIVSTDYPTSTLNTAVEVEDYTVEFDSELQVRCNPVVAAPTCWVDE